MTEDGSTSSIAARRADALYAWLVERRSSELPRSSALVRVLPELGSAERVATVFGSLVRQGLIEQRHGTIRVAPGHRIVRIIATGAVLQTNNCPLALDGPRSKAPRRVGQNTIRLVLDVVVHCADQGLRLPRPSGLGKRVGRSAETARVALTTLHDDGLLILRQRGTRWAAELPDGRCTL
jgi:hypothetical protein